MSINCSLQKRKLTLTQVDNITVTQRIRLVYETTSIPVPEIPFLEFLVSEFRSYSSGKTSKWVFPVFENQ